MRKVTWALFTGAILVGAALLLQPKAVWSKCGDEAGAKPSTVPLSALAVKSPFYVIEGDGKLSRLDLSTGSSLVVASHAFTWSPHTSPSPDFRWISYHGVRKNETASEYWLFDRASGKSRLVHSHPAWGGSIPQFSPDSKLLAISADYDRRWPSKEGSGIYLYDTETLTPIKLPNPSTVATPENQGFAHLYWSKDGSELLAMMRGFPQGQQGTREHFAYRIKDKVFERISGAYDPKTPGSEIFYRDGKRIELAATPTIQSRIRYGRLPSPDGKWMAEIDRDHVLSIASAEGRTTVGAGSYDNCRGRSIGIHGWIGDRLMVYSIDDEIFVFDASTSRQAVLFSKSTKPADFFW